MARDGFKDLTLEQAREMATRAHTELDGRNGDPSRAGNWIRERDLAAIVLSLVNRIKFASTPIEVKR